MALDVDLEVGFSLDVEVDVQMRSGLGWFHINDCFGDFELLSVAFWLVLELPLNIDDVSVDDLQGHIQIWKLVGSLINESESFEALGQVRLVSILDLVFVLFVFAQVEVLA